MFGNHMATERHYTNRKSSPPVSLYFIRAEDGGPDAEPHVLSCMFCKRTIMDDVKGTVDKMVDGPLPAHDHDFATNVQCKLCGQKYRIVAALGAAA